MRGGIGKVNDIHYINREEHGSTSRDAVCVTGKVPWAFSRKETPWAFSQKETSFSLKDTESTKSTTYFQKIRARALDSSKKKIRIFKK